MDTHGSRRPSRVPLRETRRRKMVLDLDLNDTPPGESRFPEETTAHIDTQASQNCVRGALRDVPIDVEAIDDDVVISSPRRFAEARNMSTRNHAARVVVDVDLEVHQGYSDEPITILSLNSNNSRRRSNETIISCDAYSVYGNHDAKRKKAKKWSPEAQAAPPSPPPPPAAPPKEVKFSCAICMNTLVEATTTVCGHIFCKECIKSAIAIQKKCPTCRRKLNHSNTHRIYLPATTI